MRGARTLSHQCLELADRTQETQARSEWYYVKLSNAGQHMHDLHAFIRRMRRKVKTSRPTKAYRAKYVKCMINYASQCKKLTSILDDLSCDIEEKEEEAAPRATTE